ncbi:uncharacterized protein EI90DRAFT_2828554, partial [Cantharellus anzutake]|uniref:uncharacterized protein n=1 Tax=Cantharellus anzutake TaxID=1750568 RepID=UPI001906DD49
LIARRRAKSWIIHLQDDSSPLSHTTSPTLGATLPMSQRALKGHVIVFPAKPEALSPFLPPPLQNVITLICIIFVRATTPSKDWLLKNAHPLVVWHEKVCAALQWLITHNPLYGDVVLDEEELGCLPSSDLMPVPLHVQQPTDAICTPGSHYDNLDSHPTHTPSDPNAIALQNVVVTDLDMRDASTAQITAAAIRHLKRPHGGIGGHIEVKHGKDLVNHYTDPHLLPLLYPTLFPYGVGGYHRGCRTPLSLEKMAAHL